ncbi:probable U3 small nucleolar RNA-associated protein 11 [Phlebotomus argentipes]|uniref:probable U3 small nucleolar RNA-associated protein 11 n=1 Tax=Phlebotomus argentipes TaxID=94469 RepID=UPI002892D887|nr:probable U3 small nucleolar RNA-associated protein 11 [Phlebotomus argentipes]
MSQKVHRERHQPESRKQLGILEKKKDYKVRAQHYKETRETIKILKKKALNKNADEFYHHMINQKPKRDFADFGEWKPKEKVTEESLLLKTQDLKYLTSRRTMETAQINKLSSQLHMVDSELARNKHTFFVDKDEFKHFDVAKRLNTHPRLLGNKTNRLTLEQIEKMGDLDVSEEDIQAINALKRKSYKMLKERIDREKQISEAHLKLERKVAKDKRRLAEDTEDGKPKKQPNYVRKK